MKRKLVIFLVLAVTMLGLVGCSSKNDNSFDGKRVRTVIGSTSTTGDTYMISDLVTRYLGEELNADFKVDAIGAGSAFDTIVNAEPNGETIMIFHDMTYLGVSFGAFDGEKYALENMVVGPRVGQNPGSAFGTFVDAPYDNMVEMAEFLQDNPEETIRISIEAGSVSHLGFIAYYDWVLETYGQEVVDRFSVLVGGTTAEKLQMLWDGNTDVVFADYSSMIPYTEEDVDDELKMKYLGFLDSVDGQDGMSYADQGITLHGEKFEFAKDFIIYLPEGISQELIDELDEAVKAISENPDFIKEMEALNYRAAYLSSEDAHDFIYNKRDNMDALIQKAPDLDELTQ